MKSFHLNFKLQAATKLTLLVVALGMITIFSSCNDDDDTVPDPQDIVDVAVANGYSRLADALTEAGLVSTLQGTGPFTVFAPTNAAFEAAGVTAENDFGGLTSAELAVVLTYHVVSGNITSDQLTTGDVATVQGANISIDATNLTVNGVNIVEPFDVDASNGTIHTINAVLTLPEEAPQTIVDVAVSAGYSRLADALTQAGLVMTLQGDGPFTVFAPTNAAFEAAGVTSENNFGGLSNEDLAAVLTYHVVAGNITSDQLTTGDVATVQGENISIDAENLTVNGISIEEPFDVGASNGVIHTIGTVLSLPQNIVDVAIASGYSRLADALVEAGLVETLEGDGPFTVFAPTNAAFEAAGVTSENDFGGLTAEELGEVLTYHVVAGNITSDQLTTGDVETVQGENISIDAENLTVNGIAIAEPFDVAASNGVIHTIETVLSLPQNIVELAQGTESLSILVSALTKFPDLVTALSDENGTYTVFAPTNDAFAALLGVTGQEELDDIPESVIRRVLEYHVVSGAAVFSGDLMDGQEVDPILEDANDVIVVGVGENVTVDGATVTGPDVEASNGVVHIIDGVLTPDLETSIVNTVVEPAYFSVDFEILTAAVVKAGLLGTLINPEAALTVFAPNDDAFGPLLSKLGATSVDDIDAEALEPILLYHVLGSEVKKANLPATGSAVTTLGGDFYLSINNDGVFINGVSEVIATDIDQDNGVVHVIDLTLEPASKDIVDIAVAASQAAEGAEFGQLVAALTAVYENTQTDLVGALKGDGPFTVFAPTDAAFQTLYDAVMDQDNDGDADINDLVSFVGLETIATVLQYHVLSGRVFSTDIPNVLDGNNSVPLTPLAGGNWTLNADLTITAADAALSVGLDDAAIVGTDILGTNGVIHTINQVILP